MIRALLFFFSISILNAQNPEWIIYNTSNSPLLSNSVYALEVDINNNIWIAGEGGLVKFDRTNWVTYTPSNSGIPVDRTFVIDSDRDGVLWFMGQLNYNQQLVRYNGTDWTSYTTANSPIPSNFVKAIAVDSNNIKWFFNEVNQTAYLTKFDGTTNWYTYPGYFYYAMFGELMDVDAYGNIWSVSQHILAKFNDQGYTLFNGFFGQYPSCVKADKNGNIWVACGGGGWGSLIKWDGTGYTSYDHLASSVETDSNTIWVGTGSIYPDSSGYLARLDENGWTIFNTFNSPLPLNGAIGDIEIDHYGNTWMTLYPNSSGGGGVAVYHEGGVIIPVELLSFTSFVNQNTVELRWATATELNNRGFAVERKQDNSDWEEIGFVPGAGTTTQTQFYSYSDRNVTNGIYYYRLRQIDADGSFKYSEIVQAVLDPINNYTLFQNYPNPFNPETNIKFSLAEGQLVNIKVYDILGSEIQTLVNREYNTGTHEVIFNSKGLPSGTYFYRITAGEFSDIKKLEVLK